MSVSSGTVNGSLLGRLRRHTTCPKCQGRFKQPKLLPCNHSVCRDCLTLDKGVRKGHGLEYIVSCPACKKEAELTKTGLDSLPDAFFKQHMTQACTRLEKVVSGKGCEECGKDEASLAAFCRNCESLICTSCRGDHERLRSLSEHIVVGTEEYARELGGVAQAENDDGASSSLSFRARSVSSSYPAMKCTAHKEPLKLYCRTCHVLICHDCTVKEHTPPRHKAELVDKLVSQHKSDIEEGTAVIRSHLSELKRSSSEKVSLQQGIVQQQKELCRLLDNVFQELQLELEHRKRKLVREIEAKAEEETKKISHDLARLDTKKSELESLIRACTEALQHTTDQEFMVLRRDLQTRLKEMSVKRPMTASASASSLPAEMPNLSLTVSCAEEIKAACKDVALKSLIVNRSKSKIHKLKSSLAEVGRDIQIIFSAITSDNKPCIEPLELKVKVIVPRFELEVETLIAPSLSLGTYMVTFTPAKKGEHLLFIYVGGEEIECCPFRVPVRSSKMDLGFPEKVLNKKEWAWGVACGSVDRLVYVTENYNHCISVWDKNGKLVRNIGHKGHKPGQLLQPTGIAVTREGIIFIADGKDVGRIQKLSKTGHPMAHFTGLDEPHGVTINGSEDRVYVCENGSQNITVFDMKLNKLESFGALSCSLDQGYHDPAMPTTLESPHSMALDVQGNIYVTDTMGGYIHVYESNGTHIRSISHPHDEEFAPSGIAIEDERLFIADRGGNQVVVFTTTGDFITATGSYGTGSGQFQNPSGLAIDVDGYLYVCDYGNSRIQVF